MILNGIVRKVLNTKGGFTANTKEGEGVNHEGRRGREFQAVALRWESIRACWACWACFRNSMEVNVGGIDWGEK